MNTINIYENNVYAGTGDFDENRTAIENCPAVLGDDPEKVDDYYCMIEDAIDAGEESASAEGYVWTWSIS